MRETPGYEHLEAWCQEMTLDGAIANSGAEELIGRAKVAGSDADRALRVARSTPITKAGGRKRHARMLRAARAKARAIYLVQLAAAVRSAGTETVGELGYDAAHAVLAHANAFGAAWLRRQEAV